MRYPVVILSLISLALCFCYVVYFIQVRARPTVVVDGGEVFDSGVVVSKAPLVHIFRVENPHPFPVQVSALTNGCACTTSVLSASTIPSHGSVEVSLRVAPEDGEIQGSAFLTSRRGGMSVDTYLFVTGAVAQIQRGSQRLSRI